MTLEEARQNEIEYCREHIVYFIDHYGKIEDKDAVDLIQPFKMWPAQREALLSIMQNKKNIILKARQLGFSWLVMHIVVHLILLSPGKTAVGMSRTEEEAKELIRRVGVILRCMGMFVQEDKFAPPSWKWATFSQNALEITIKFPDLPESKFKCFPSSPGSGRSFTANLIIFDEWAFQGFAEEIWRSAYPTINSASGDRKVIGLSTNERGSLFEKLFTDKDNGFNKIFIPWYADPKRDQEWYDSTLSVMGKEAMALEYPATIDEALTNPGGAFFDEVKEGSHETDEVMDGNVLRYVSIDYGLDMFYALWYTVDERGYAQIYREYYAPNLTIGAACDVLHYMSEGENIRLYIAPPDLWNRSQESGKSRGILFSENGIDLEKSNNDFEDGCAAMKEWLNPEKKKLSILRGTAPRLIECLRAIQRDKHRPNVYAKEPHDLTHGVDALRYFCNYWVFAPQKRGKTNTWKEWQWEDYNNATSDEERKQIIAQYGEPS